MCWGGRKNDVAFLCKMRDGKSFVGSVRKSAFKKMAKPYQVQNLERMGQEALLSMSGHEAAHVEVADIPDQIRKLSDLHVAGALTETEFSEKKAELLSRI